MTPSKLKCASRLTYSPQAREAAGATETNARPADATTLVEAVAVRCSAAAGRY